VRVPRLGDINDNFLGKVVILHDITNLKTAQDQALRSRDIAEALVVTGITLNSALELNEVLNLILDQISRVLDFDYGSFQAIKDNDLEVVAVRGFEQPEAILGLHYTISGHSPNRDAILERRPVRIADIRHFDNFLLRQFAPDICSYIAVPILAKDKVTGILALYSKETNHFTEEDQRISESFAGQVAIAVENAHIFEQIREMATTDTLTGLYNRRQFYTMAEIELARSTRYNKPMTIMVIDLDHFKKVNDTYGHAAGDITLRNIARLCQLVLRKIDLVGRLGGEEFGVLLPETSLKDALIAAERLRETIANTTIEFKGDEIAVTASIGAAQSFGLDDTLEAILERADYALYEAKEAGRNQIHLYQAVERPLAVELP
jgi:diguanylate cyclase (GGDEF)-like protein